jgi:5-methylcytosine-specific restriction endonuclease McrA
MIRPIPKPQRVRLDKEAYADLRRWVLARDGSKCQSCGSRIQLEVHHLEKRSQLGSDIEENLITLCAACHRQTHAG